MLQEYVIVSGRPRKAKKVICLSCQKEFLKQLYYVNKSPNHFCCRECVYEYQRKDQVLVQCNICLKETKRSLSKLDKSIHRIYFCSRECRDKGQRIENNLQDLWPSHYTDGHFSNYRKLAFDKLPNICNRCNTNLALVVHHKDRNRLNNNISNLEILCSNCHYIEHH